MRIFPFFCPLLLAALLTGVTGAAETTVFSRFNTEPNELARDYNQWGQLTPSKNLTWSATAGTANSGGLLTVPGAFSNGFYGPDDNDYTVSSFDLSDNATDEPLRASIDFRFSQENYDKVQYLAVGFQSPSTLPSILGRIQSSDNDNYLIYLDTRGFGGAADIVNATPVTGSELVDGHWYRLSLTYQTSTETTNNGANLFPMSLSLQHMGADGHTPGAVIRSASRKGASFSPDTFLNAQYRASYFLSNASATSAYFVSAIDNFSFTDNVEIPTDSVAASTISEVNAYAWSANSGWINFRPSEETGVSVGDTHLSGYAYHSNTGWIFMGNGSPANGLDYANQNGEHGVNHDGRGNLSGYAWCANTGWINFGWAAGDDGNRPRIDLLTGNFHGYAWSPNIGWITLGSSQLQTVTIRCKDEDSDGLSDFWELAHFSDLSTAFPTWDNDGDGHSDAVEHAYDTDPDDAVSFPFFRIRRVANITNDAFAISFPSSSRRVYTLETSTDLGLSDVWAPVIGLEAFLGQDAITDQAGTIIGPRRFYRLRIRKPLSP